MHVMCQTGNSKVDCSSAQNHLQALDITVQKLLNMLTPLHKGLARIGHLPADCGCESSNFGLSLLSEISIVTPHGADPFSCPMGTMHLGLNLFCQQRSVPFAFSWLVGIMRLGLDLFAVQHSAPFAAEA